MTKPKPNPKSKPLPAVSPQRPSVLIVAGNDSSGMAGLQRDCQSLSAFGIHARTVITANTAQDVKGVHAINAVTPEGFASQLKAALNESVLAIKTGLFANREQLEIFVEAYQASHRPALIVDPVLAASSGEYFANDALINAFQSTLFPLATLVCPNIGEAEKFIGKKIDSAEAMEAAANTLHQSGAENILLKGGHAKGEICRDFFLSNRKFLSNSNSLPNSNQFWLASSRLETDNSRGTGCAQASSIAASIALGYSIEDAVVLGKMAINQGLRNSYSVAQQKGPVWIEGFPNQEIDLPTLTRKYVDTNNTDIPAFTSPTLPDGNDVPLGLYPVVDTADWIERLLKLGVTTIQLRCKTLEGQALSDEIAQAVTHARDFNTRLFINDYWQLAIEHGAYGVHLGQEDLDDADLVAIKQAGLRLGISTHCHYEVARAHSHRPSYIAYGPVYHTDSKPMPWIPQGPKGFAYWRQLLNYPMVAIGGINAERIADVAAAGAEGIAMISAITQAEDPDTATLDLIKRMTQ